MREIIENIIKEIERGVAFDSHFIIDTLIRDYSDDYLTFVSVNLATSGVTEYAHSEIAKLITLFEGSIIKRLPMQSWSYNIRGKASKCALWERLSNQ
jgi:hypothetical protein